MTVRVRLANRIWLRANRHGHRRFQAALGDVRRVQERLLFGYLRRNANTQFGRTHGFADIRSVDDFRHRVPLSRYEDYAPYIARIAEGEARILTRDAVKLLEPSSGSSGAAKWIPYTGRLQSEFRRAVAPWIVEMARQRPGLLDGPAYWSITPALAAETSTPTRVPIGFADDAAYLGGIWRQLVNSTLVVPPEIRHLHDVGQFRRATLLRLLASRDLRLISVWHPSFLRLLVEHLREHWDQLIGDLARGGTIAATIRVPPDPHRARDLASMGPDSLCDIWPELQLISCWGDGAAAQDVPPLQALFPCVEIQTKGLVATEAFVTVPFREEKPVAVTSHFFEFLDATEHPYGAWELECGHAYSVVVTTGGGLYRYRLHDRVEVTGYVGETPSLRFVGKEDHVSDWCGEKLSEAFVGGAIRRVLARIGCRPSFAMLALETGGSPPHYVLFVDVPIADVPAATCQLEGGLRENPNYDYCVRLGQLGPVAIRPVAPDASRRYVARLHGRGQRLGDIKPTALSSLKGWSEVLDPVGTVRV